jgi:hypothetical protein
LAHARLSNPCVMAHADNFGQPDMQIHLTKKRPSFPKCLELWFNFHVICFQDIVQMGDSYFLTAMGDLGFTDKLVAMLKHESPYCVGPAASVLHGIGKLHCSGPALIGASSAIPALVRVITAARPPVLPDVKSGMSQRCAAMDTFLISS